MGLQTRVEDLGFRVPGQSLSNAFLDQEWKSELGKFNLSIKSKQVIRSERLNCGIVGQALQNYEGIKPPNHHRIQESTFKHAQSSLQGLFERSILATTASSKKGNCKIDLRER